MGVLYKTTKLFRHSYKKKSNLRNIMTTTLYNLVRDIEMEIRYWTPDIRSRKIGYWILDFSGFDIGFGYRVFGLSGVPELLDFLFFKKI